LSRPDQGVSLAEVLGQIGLGCKLGRESAKPYREEWTKKGFQEGLAADAMRVLSSADVALRAI
jgi:hypothetical protein